VNIYQKPSDTLIEETRSILHYKTSPAKMNVLLEERNLYA
jgi:hypothetical protein